MTAANERAIARRISKESTELIEDECLELMELAASKKGLSYILALDRETIQNLKLYGDGWTSFPPKFVQLKRIFSIKPWSDSDENVGNLLMVWTFLITFVDLRGIWPFTLDELVQAFHDHDPRLLGEIHIALLRSIMEDIEEVARTPSSGLGCNQNSVVNSGGRHPRVVEGAYLWAFDIRNWQQHLNPLTWLEIWRQFALSAGFGPQLKKQNMEQVHPCNKNEGPVLIVDNKNSKSLPTSHDLNELSNELLGNQNHLQSSPLEVNMQMPNCSIAPQSYSFQQSGYAVEKSKSNLKSYTGHLAEQTYMYRSLPLGLDQRHNRYWQFITSAQNDPGWGRIFVELHDGQWKLIDSEEGFDALLASVDVRGIRESHLHMMLQRIELYFKESVRRNVQNVNMRMKNGHYKETQDRSC